MSKSVLGMKDLRPDDMNRVLELAQLPPDGLPRVLAGKGAALIFEKPSARTRNSTEMAVVALGGHPVYITDAEVAMGRRETPSDVARTLALYHGVICARVKDHRTLEEMSEALEQSEVPVVNLLSDREHPCQALADLLTIRQVFGEISGKVVAYVGDPNNVWRSLGAACSMAQAVFRFSSPAQFAPSGSDLAELEALGGNVDMVRTPAEAVAGADVIYTDVWTSMGEEDQASQRRIAFADYSVNRELVELAAPHAVVMHCLPAHRGEEITADVLEGPRSVVWRQAANRMHAMRGLFVWLFESGGID